MSNNYIFDMDILKEEDTFKISNFLDTLDIDILKKEIEFSVYEYNKIPTNYPAIKEIFDLIKSIEKNDIKLSQDALLDGYSNNGRKTYIMSLKPDEIAKINLVLLPFLKNEYRKNNIDLSIFYSTISDIFLRLSNHQKKYSKLGLESSEGNWLLRIFFMNIFKLGSLQFEKYMLNFSDFTDTKKVDQNILERFDKQDLLSIHIMEGEDISDKSVKNSLDLARQFFGRKYRYFYCRSWLLYDGLKDLLPESSNILSFAKNFDIIFKEDDKTMAEERIFGDTFSHTSKNITTLQKNALSNPQSLGVGVGIIRIFPTSI